MSPSPAPARDGRRLRFIAALLGFALWVSALGWLAVGSGRKPPPRLGSGASNPDRPPLAGRPFDHVLVMDPGAV